LTPQPTLTPEGWQTILNQAKNAGLKAANLGVTRALNAVVTAKHEYEQNQTPQHHQNYRKALLDLKTLSDQVYQRHHNVYTTACQYLQAVGNLAQHRARDLDGEWAQVQREHEEHVRQQAEHDRQERARAELARKKTELRGIFEAGIHQLRDVKTLDELRHYWPEFVQHVVTAGGNTDALDEVVMHIQHFQPHVDNPQGLLSYRPVYIKCVQDAGTALSRV